MAETIELVWLTNLLVVIGSAALGWTLVGWIQQRLNAGISDEGEK